MIIDQTVHLFAMILLGWVAYQSVPLARDIFHHFRKDR